MGKGVAGKKYLLEFDDGGGYQSLGVVTCDYQPSWDTDDTTETQQDTEDTTPTLLRQTINGEKVYQEAAADSALDDFITAFFAATEIGVRLTPAGATPTTNRRVTLSGCIIQSLGLPNNGPSGTVRVPFTLRCSDGTAPTVGTVA